MILDNRFHLPASRGLHHAVRYDLPILVLHHPRRTSVLRGPHSSKNAMVATEVESPQGAKESHHADDHPEVAHAIDDEGLVGRRRSTVPLEIKADQKVRADTDQLPKHKRHRHVARNDNPQHAEAKQRKILKEAVIATPPVIMAAARHGDLVILVVLHQFVVHVAHGVEVDARGDDGHHAEHDHGQSVDVITDGQPQIAKLDQRVPVTMVGRLAGESRCVRVGVARIADVAMTVGLPGVLVFRLVALPRTVRMPMIRAVTSGVRVGVVIRGRMSGVAVMPAGRPAMLAHPGGQPHQGEDNPRQEGAGGHKARPAAQAPHPRSEEANGHEGGQRQQPGDQVQR